MSLENNSEDTKEAPIVIFFARLFQLLFICVVFALGWAAFKFVKVDWFITSLADVEAAHKSTVVSPISLLEFKTKHSENTTDIQFENFEKAYSGLLVSWNVKVKNVTDGGWAGPYISVDMCPSSNGLRQMG